MTELKEKRLPVVYIAGPYTAPTRWQQEQNVRRAEDYAMWIAKEGAVPLCPHSMYRHFDGTLDAVTWYAYTAELLFRCDALFLLPRWVESRGAREEAAHAIKLQLPSFEKLAVLGAWVQREWRDQPRMTFDDDVRLTQRVEER